MSANIAGLERRLQGLGSEGVRPGTGSIAAPAGGATVVVPARDEAASVSSLLESLLSQTRPPDEVVVCDAGSQDATREIVRSFEDRGVRLVEAGPAYPGRARNVGVGASRRAWVAFVDCGCRAAPDWLEQLVAIRDADPSAEIVYGDYDPLVASDWEAAQTLVLLSPRDPKTGCRPPSTASMLIRRDLFLEVGGFPADLRAAEDLSFFDAIRRRGTRTVRAPRAVVRWSLMGSPGAFYRRLRMYSAHHARAGLARTWHHRVLLMDLVAAALLVLSLWLPAALLGLAAGFVTRLLKTVVARRDSAPPEARRLTPGRLARAGVLLVLADAACVLGYFDYLRGRVATSPS